MCYTQIHNALVYLCVYLNGRIVKCYRRFGESYCLHPQGLAVQKLLEDDLF